MRIILLMFLVLELVFTSSTYTPPVQAKNTTSSPVYYKNKVLVLMYHHIDKKESGATITSERFESHLKMLKEKGYKVISSEHFAEFLKKKKTVPPNAVVLTFDDGYESFYTHAFPLLKKYNMVATHFIIGSSTQKQPQWNKHLSWDQMREMKEAGNSFYNHTYNLHDYKPINSKGKTAPMLANKLYLKDKKRVETDSEYKSRIYTDLKINEDLLNKELKNKYHMIAFPYGAYNDTVVRVGKQLDMSVFYTIKPGINKSGQELIYRINAGSPKITADSLFKTMKQYK